MAVKNLKGYVLDIPAGAPIAGVPVTIKDRLNNTVSGGSTNPTTSAADGSFTWSIDLSPGPIHVDAVVSGSETKHRYGDEQFQVGYAWDGDIVELGSVFTNGVFKGRLNELNCTNGGGTRELVLNTGRSVWNGYVLGIDTALSFIGSANATLTNRWDLIVARQYISGADKGKQQLLKIEGSVNGVDPVITLADTVTTALWRGVLPLGASAYNNPPTDLRTYALAGVFGTSAGTLAEGNHTHGAGFVAKAGDTMTGILDAEAGVQFGNGATLQLAGTSSVTTGIFTTIAEGSHVYAAPFTTTGILSTDLILVTPPSNLPHQCWCQGTYAASNAIGISVFNNGPGSILVPSGTWRIAWFRMV